jgi:hypothetical protein
MRRVESPKKEQQMMRTLKVVTGMAAMLMLVAPAFGQGEKEGQGQAVVTILPKHAGDTAPNLSAQDIKLKVDGKDANVSNLVALRGAHDNLEMVVLIDGGARSSLGNQLDELSKFIISLPPNARVAVAYMEFGRAVFQSQLTTDHAAAARGLHLPAGIPGSNGSPYFCISDLAKRWPQGDGTARREVLMVTDGVDEYNRRYDPEDPYVQAAANDAVRAGLVVYAIYFRNQGRADNTRYENNAGQNLILQVTDATGGKSFWEGTGNPVSFDPFLEELGRRLRNQYELSFLAHSNGKPTIQTLKLKVSAPGTEIDSPHQVLVARPGLAQN